MIQDVDKKRNHLKSEHVAGRWFREQTTRSETPPRDPLDRGISACPWLDNEHGYQAPGQKALSPG
jgi:hypothetical protein